MNKQTNVQGNAAVLVWWVLWLGITGGLVAIWFFLGRDRDASSGGLGALAFVAVVPLLVSSVLRWLVLPKINQQTTALMVFIVGLSLAEGCGILGIFLGGEHSQTLFALGLLGLLQWVPLFAGRLYHEPARSG